MMLVTLGTYWLGGKSLENVKHQMKHPTDMGNAGTQSDAVQFWKIVLYLWTEWAHCINIVFMFMCVYLCSLSLLVDCSVTCYCCSLYLIVTIVLKKLVEVIILSNFSDSKLSIVYGLANLIMFIIYINILAYSLIDIYIYIYIYI